jgi:transcriptional regulator with XRE-family HTH domain
VTENQSGAYLKGLLAGDADTAALQLEEGRLLVPLLFKVAVHKGESIETLCAALGVTKGFLNQIETEFRKPSSISDELARKCAQYLGVPFLAVHILSGRISKQDAESFDAFAGTSLAEAFDTVMKFSTSKDVD